MYYRRIYIYNLIKVYVKIFKKSACLKEISEISGKVTELLRFLNYQELSIKSQNRTDDSNML